MRSLAIRPQEKDYIRLFNLRTEWTLEELKGAFRQLAKKCHPDANPGNREADAYFKFVNQAYETLSLSYKKLRASEPADKTSPKKKPLEEDIASEDLYEKLVNVILKSREKNSSPTTKSPLQKLNQWLNRFHL